MKCWVELKVKPNLRLLDFEHLPYVKSNFTFVFSRRKDILKFQSKHFKNFLSNPSKPNHDLWSQPF